MTVGSRRLLGLVAVHAVFAATSVGSALAVGEAVDGFPNWRERVIHAWINRARSDPQFEMTACGSNCAEKACYAPLPPLPWSLALNRAARFHSDEMLRQSYFAHDSRCTVTSNIDALYPDSCNGAASCACSGSGSTAWWQRIQLFGASGSGEIIASPTDPDFAFYLWLYEPSSTTACAFTSANGHRWLILKASGSVGAGVSGPAVGDFGNGGTPARIPSGSHYPQQASTVQMWANWYDSAAPSAAAVNVDGVCTPMVRARGSATNGAYNAAVSAVGTGCHRYYFEFRDAAGAEVTYPTTGSLAIGSGSGCPDWSSERPPPCDAAATATPTSMASLTSTPSATATRTPTGTPTPPHTRTATPTPTWTPSPSPTVFVSGQIRYRGATAGLASVSVQVIEGVIVGETTTNAIGSYALGIGSGEAQVVPLSDLDLPTAVTAADAAALLATVVAGGTADPVRIIAGDVSGNGALSAFDAALILRRAAGLLAEFPAAAACGWGTAYVPLGNAASAVLPDPATCRRGRYGLAAGSSTTVGLDFEAIQLGDVDAGGP